MNTPAPQQIPFSKEQFVSFIALIQDTHEKARQLYDFSNGAIDIGDYFPICELLDWLAVLTRDQKMAWIDYFVWELDFGKKWHPMCVTVDDKDVPLGTPEDLYAMLIDNYTHCDSDGNYLSSTEGDDTHE